MAGRWSYRLRQIDLDGTIHFSPEVIVDVLTGVRDNSLPVVFALHQNYPNPFNPTTSLNYDLPATVHVTLKVFNVLGQEVATLVDKTQTAGRYNVSWNASGVGSGVYFYQILAGSFIDVKKMAIMR
jgi:hypothetical protein